MRDINHAKTIKVNYWIKPQNLAVIFSKVAIYQGNNILTTRKTVSTFEKVFAKSGSTIRKQSVSNNTPQLLSLQEKGSYEIKSSCSNYLQNLDYEVTPNVWLLFPRFSWSFMGILIHVAAQESTNNWWKLCMIQVVLHLQEVSQQVQWRCRVNSSAVQLL